MKYFNNLATAGASLAGIDNLTQQLAPEMATTIEEVEVLAMLNDL